MTASLCTTWESWRACAHYFVDSISPEIYHNVVESDTTWHAKNWGTSCRSINIEASSIIRHYDVTGKRCPASYVGTSKWSALMVAIRKAAQVLPSAAEAAEAPEQRRLDRFPSSRRRSLRASLATTARVNELLGTGGPVSSSGGTNIDALARAVIHDVYNNREERKRQLSSNYSAVQKNVNMSSSRSSPVRGFFNASHTLEDLLWRAALPSGRLRPHGRIARPVRVCVNDNLP